MKYLIANALIYRPEDGVLMPPGREEELVTLTATANAILSLLVERHGVAIERETFLSEVWDSRGLRGSNSSLNQYISILRKTLAIFAPEHQFIITVPKIGFMLNSELSVQRQSNEDERPTVNAPRATTKPKKQRWLWPALLILITLIHFAFGMGKLLVESADTRVDVLPLTKVGQCPIYTLSPLPEAWHEEAISMAHRILQRVRLPACQPNTVFYFFVQDSIFYGEGGRVVLTRCVRNAGKAVTCHTQYYYEW
jgi:DNA-binding winged helix-turn-helix (wHTH) protein